MRLDQFTVKAQEALTTAQTLAEKSDHPEVTTEHLLKTLLDQEGGVVPSALGKLGVNTGRPRGRRREEPRLLARTRRARPPTSRRSWTASSSRPCARRRRSRTSTSPPSTCCWPSIELEDPGRRGARAGGRHPRRPPPGAQGDPRQPAADDPNAEDRYQALEKYGRDLTELARKGKLDPVIGRDDEIRRVMQVLSRRTKNNPVLIGEPGRRQDRHRRGPRPAHRQGRRARVAQEQARRRPRPRAP